MLKGWLPAASRLLIIEEGVVIITQTKAQVGTFPDIVHLARKMVVIGPVALRDLGKQCFSLISKGPSCYLCQLVLVENFIVTFSLVSTGEDAVIVLNIKLFLPVLNIPHSPLPHSPRGSDSRTRRGHRGGRDYRGPNNI